MATLKTIDLAVAIRDRKTKNPDWEPTIKEVSVMIRKLFCKHRRFTDCVYISHNGSTKREYSDAWSEVLLGKSYVVGSMCASYPMTKTLRKSIDDRRKYWMNLLVSEYFLRKGN